MALREQCEPSAMRTAVRKLTTGSVTKGVAAIQENVYGFWVDSVTYSATDLREGANNAVLCYEAENVEIDAAAATYNAGDYVYDDDTTPTGIINLTSGAGRRRVGIAKEGKVLGAQGKLLIQLTGAA